MLYYGRLKTALEIYTAIQAQQTSKVSSMGSTTRDTALHDRHVTDDCNAPAKTEKGYAFGSLWPW